MTLAGVGLVLSAALPGWAGTANSSVTSDKSTDTTTTTIPCPTRAGGVTSTSAPGSASTTTTTPPCVVGKVKELWKGTVKIHYEGADCAVPDIDSTVTLEVHEKNTVIATFAPSQRPAYDCQGVSVSASPFPGGTLYGKRRGHQFVLGDPATGLSVHIKIAGKRAHGREVRPGGAGTSATETYDLRCRRC